MKKLIYLVLLSLFALSVTYCTKEKIVEKIVEQEVLTEPQLISSSDTLKFTDNETKNIYISTKPASDCDFQVAEMPNWIEVSPESGTITSDVAQINVTSKFTSEQAGNYTGHLILISTSGIDTVLLEGTVSKNIAVIVPDTLNISIFENNKELTLTNNSNTAITYQATTSNDYISISPSSGEIPSGQNMVLEVTANRTGMTNGTYQSQINLSLDTINKSVGVLINHFKEEKKILTSEVIDAEYSKKTDMLVYASANKSRIYFYSTTSGAFDSLDVAYPPTCVSISSDGNYAAIGHDAHISYVDIQNRSLIRTYSVSCQVGDLVLGDNNWAYAFPKVDQWEYIRCVNLNLPYDNETLQTGYQIRAGTLARMHPSGKYIYGADNGQSPSDIEKYNIQNGTAEYMYDSPYHGDYPMDGNLWFSDDGTRIFTRGGTVVKTSEIKDQDMLYNGTITLPSSTSYSNAMIQWLDYSTKNNQLYIISTGENWGDVNKPYVYVYNASNLTYEQSYDLEKYLVPDNSGGGTLYDPVPYFVFSDSSGKTLIVLTKANGSGLVNEWALQKIAVQ